MRGRIFTADDTDVGAMKGLGSDSKLKGWILRLRGLPFNATDEDVVRRRWARPCTRHCAAPLPRQLYRVPVPMAYKVPGQRRREVPPARPGALLGAQRAPGPTAASLAPGRHRRRRRYQGI